MTLLTDIRVVDLTDGYGALATRVLAELGAEVLRVEAPGGGSGARRAPVDVTGTSLHHVHRNAGKAIVVLAPDVDAEAVGELLRGADLVVVAADGWGSDDPAWSPGSIAQQHPHLVVVSLTPFGLTGPSSGWAATELVAQALAGVVFRAGVPELPPVAAPGSFCEDVGAVTAAMAGALALFQAGAEGRGQVVDVSAILALAQCTDTALPLWSLLGSDQTRLGAGLYPLFECSDGLERIVLPMTPGDWRALISWLGSPPEWSGPDWDQPMLGPNERAQVLERLPEKFAGRTREEVTADGDAAGVRVTPVLTPREVLGNEHVTARGTFALHEVAPGRTGAVTAGFFGVDGARAGVAGPGRRVDHPPAWPGRTRAEPGGPQPAGLPLEGLRVVELGTGVAAPEAGRVLAEWGAEVIKVESRRRPDFQRRVLGSDMNPAFGSPNRCKLLLGADISRPEGRDLVEDLVRCSDVVLENSATGVLDRLGLGWDVLSGANPRVVMVSSQLYGDRGPWAWRKGYGPSARAVGGLTWLWAHGPEAPRGVQSIHPDHLAGRLGALAAIAALLARERTGRGHRVDIAQFEVVAALLGDLLLAESLESGAAQPTGNRSSEHAPWGLFRCADDASTESWLAVCVTGDAEWAALRSVAGGALEDREEWRTTAGRLHDVERLEAAIARWLAAVDAETIESALQAAGVAAGRALHPRLQVAHPHFIARGFPVPVDQPGSGLLVYEGPAFAGSRMGSPRCGAAPLPGADTHEVCRRILGMDDAAIDHLAGAGVLDLA